MQRHEVGHKMVYQMVFSLIGTIRDRKGVSSMEYAILAVAIIGAVSAAMTQLGTDIGNLFNALETAITNATTGGAATK
jgi:Flp pilus assembly pilin Flp